MYDVLTVLLMACQSSASLLFKKQQHATGSSSTSMYRMHSIHTVHKSKLAAMLLPSVYLHDMYFFYFIIIIMHIFMGILLYIPAQTPK